MRMRGYAEHLRSRVAGNKSLAGTELTEEERINYNADAAWIERALAEAPQVKILPPTLTIEDRLTLQRGKRVIDIRYLGRGHTGADLIVHRMFPPDFFSRAIANEGVEVAKK